MNDAKAIWERYVLAWNSASLLDKRELYRQCLSPDCVYTDPLKQTKGWSELEAYMSEFHQQLPGARFVTQSFATHHGRSIASWQMVDASGSVIGTGTSFGEYDEQLRLRAMTGFFEVPGSQTAA